MKNLIAKRYIKALSCSLTYEELFESLHILAKLCGVYEIEKFREILKAPHICSSKKVSFIIESILENTVSVKMANFIRVLGEHNRLDLFEELYTELSSYLYLLNNQYVACLLGNQIYTDEIIKEFASRYGRKLGVELIIQQKIVKEPGIKFVVENLGIEIAFLENKFIRDFKNHILKAF